MSEMDESELERPESMDDEDEEDNPQFYEENPNSIYESSMLMTRVHTQDAVSVAISPCGKFVVTGGCDNIAHVFKPSISYKLPVASFQASDTVSQISFSPDSKYVAFIAGDVIYVINLEKNRPPLQFSYDGEFSYLSWYILAPYYTAAGQHFLMTISPKSKYIMSIEVGASLSIANGLYYTGDEPTSLNYHFEKNSGVVSFKDRNVLFFTVVDFKAIISIHLEDYVVDVKPGHDGELYFGLFAGQVAVCVPTEDSKYKLAGYFSQKREEGPTSCLAFSQTMAFKILAVGSLAGVVEIYNLRNGSLIYDYHTQDTSVMSMTFDSTASHLFVACFDGRIYVIDVTNGKLKDVLHSRGDITTFAYDMFEYNNKFVAGAVSSKGHLRYFVWPPVEENEKFILGETIG